jgi:adenine-specific DNA-methyltransferase
MLKSVCRTPGIIITFDSPADKQYVDRQPQQTVFAFEDATMKPAPEQYCLQTESDIVAAAVALGAPRFSNLSPAELSLIRRVAGLPAGVAEGLRRDILRKQDPLGDAFSVLRTPAKRRERGATYTPLPIVEAMVNWAATLVAAAACEPARVIDPGVGSGRFLLAAGRKFPNAELIGIDIDSVATLIARGNLAAAGFEDRSRVLLADYRDVNLPPAAGKTLYLGNPPYVRHHLLSAKWKRWLTTQARGLGYKASQLAGLHVHFFLATVLRARAGDFGSFITAAEWLDVNYGRLVRAMFLNELGGQSLTLIEPTDRPFADAASTAVISTFQIGSRPKSIHIRRVDHASQIVSLQGGLTLPHNRLKSEARWSHLTRHVKAAPAGFIELGELCRVHRGQVTGANRVWIAGKHSLALPSGVLFRSVTKARELFQAGRVLSDESNLRYVIDLPVDLSVFDCEERKAIDGFLRVAKAAGVSEGYVAANRKAWWSVGLKAPAPILATYMARRPPAFVRNLIDARHINIAHGLYPRGPLSPEILDRLAAYLGRATDVSHGRTYAGGLTKFEPREMERLIVPGPEMLVQAEE